jgi:DUF4097 and DUF4098 domain-containing protein YvlB
MNTFQIGPKGFALSATLLLAAVFAGRANADDYTKTYSIGERADVRVRADEGNVLVITEDTHQVELRVHTEGTHAALQIGGHVKIDSHQSGDTVELTVKTNAGVMIGFIPPKSIKTEVHMPRNADLLIETHDGSVEVSAVNGRVTIHTEDGAIKAFQLGGNVELSSADGSIGAHDIDGKLNVSSKDGSIRAEGRFDVLDVRSGDGSVIARATPGSRMESTWNVETQDGSVRLTVPSDLQANLDVSSTDGRIAVKLPVTVQGFRSKSQLQGTLNGGGPSLTVRSVDGSVQIDGI